MQGTITIGVSACLLGENVRYNGGHTRDSYITDTLGNYFTYYPVCPEVECGLSIPREAMRLVGDPAAPRLVTIKSNVDYTEQMLEWATGKVADLAAQDLCGFIFMHKSPSSGMERVKVYNDKGVPEKKGVGLFAGMFMRSFPLIPVEENGRLHDPVLRENFIERIFVLKRWRDVQKEGRKPGVLVEFHTVHKLQILSHSPTIYRTMGKLTADTKAMPIETLYATYERQLMEALLLKASVSKNLNVMHHVLGYFKKNLSADEKAEMLQLLENYRERLVPLIVPITLLNHYVRKYDEPYLKRQTYLNPHPMELKLRNHV